MKWLFLFFYMALLPFLFYGQGPPFTVEIGGGLGAGWWVYNKGLTDTLPHFHQGYDRTHLSLLWLSDVALSYEGSTWSLGVGAGVRILSDDQMIGSENRRGGFRKYTVAEKGHTGIPMQHLFLQGRFYLFQKPNMSIGLQGKMGTFLMVHNHPRKHTFGFPLSQEVGIIHLIHLSPHVSFFVRPEFANFRIGTQGGFAGEQHNVYTLSVAIGLRVGNH